MFLNGIFFWNVGHIYSVQINVTVQSESTHRKYLRLTRNSKLEAVTQWPVRIGFWTGRNNCQVIHVSNEHSFLYLFNPIPIPTMLESASYWIDFAVFKRALL